VYPEEAIQAALDLGARAAVGMHFGTFDLSDEPIDEPPRRFLAAARARGPRGPPDAPRHPG
jgi:N-acyl-phosphatidylethanolamine-hydrolysing phospholipase D